MTPSMKLILGLFLLFGCFVEPLVIRDSDQLTLSWGNDFDQAHHFFSLTTRFNASDYFLDYNFCTTKSPKPYQCLRYVNRLHREYSRLWGPPAPDTTDKYPRKVLDCKYDIKHAHTASSLTGTVFSFVLHQSECMSKTTIKGGAIFDAFGYSDYALASCRNTDHFNDSSPSIAN